MSYENSRTDSIRLPRLISDGMVLQRNSPIPIWGWAKAGQSITVRLLTFQVQTITASDGKWELTMPKQAPGGPYTMEITTDGQKILVRDIFIGDVWLCSGQSNMQLPMERVKDQYPDIVAHANNDRIRLFTVPMRYDFKVPCENLESGCWFPVLQDTILQFTAAGYFFADELYSRYGVPIGLINTAIGGSPVEAWLSEESLKKFPETYQAIDPLRKDSFTEKIKREEEAREHHWHKVLNARDKGLQNGLLPWYNPQVNDTDWPVMNLPDYWAVRNSDCLNGVFWFRKEIAIPAAMVGMPARIFMGRIVDHDTVYINGVFVGSTSYQYPPRKYDIPPDVLKKGRNIIAVRVISYRGKGGFIKEKTYQLQAGTKKIDLKGTWKYQIGAVMEILPQTTFFQYKPLGLYNGMIAPLIHYPILGVLWYQGESNTERPENYQALFTQLIADWRHKWRNGKMPFLYVQLPNYLERENPLAIHKWPLLREAQLKTMKIPNTAMAVAIDLGEWNDLHPLNKRDIGKRLAIAAENIAYGERNIVATGPIYQSLDIAGNKISLQFTHRGAGLYAKDGQALANFEITDATGKYIPANAKIEGDRVIVWNDLVSSPVAVRYAWKDNPENINFYNQNGLPASPFRTDPDA